MDKDFFILLAAMLSSILFVLFAFPVALICGVRFALYLCGN